MKKRLAIAMVLLAGSVHAEHPMDLLRSGLSLGRTNQYAEAAELFAAAATNATAAGLDPSVAVYDEALAHLKAGEPEKAALRFSDALRTENTALRRDAHVNRAAALMELSAELEKSEKMDPAIKAVQEAQTMLKQAIELDRSDLDAKTNFELALRREQELLSKPKPPPKQDQDKSENEKDQQKPPPDQDQQQQDQQKDDPKNSEPDKQQEQPKDQEEQKPSPPKDKQGSDQDKQEQREAQAGEEQRPAEQMTPEEAKALLDAMRKAEESQREKARTRNLKIVPVEKDW